MTYFICQYTRKDEMSACLQLRLQKVNVCMSAMSALKTTLFIFYITISVVYN